MKQIKKSNQGFSLVETLIAMSVLVICGIPLLRAFVISASNNLSGRQLLNATAIAENTIEEIKSTGVEQFVMANSITPTNMISIDGTSYPIYEMQNDSFEFDGKEYELSITLTPSTLKTDNGVEEEYINFQETPQLYSMNARTDAVYVQQVADVEQVVDSYVNAHIGYSKTELMNNITVTHNFNVDFDTTTKYYYIKKETVYKNGGETIMVKNDTIYCSYDAPPRSLYVCYVPTNETGVSATTPRDTVTVRLGSELEKKLKELDNPLNFYLVRQGTNTVAPVAVNLLDSNSGSLLSNGKTFFAMHTNIKVDNMILMHNTTRIADALSAEKIDFSSLTKDGNSGVAIYKIEVSVGLNDDTLTTLTGTALR